MMNKKIEEFRGIGDKKKKAFNKIGVYSSFDAIKYFPATYMDMRKPIDIIKAKDYIDSDILIRGKVKSIRKSGGYGSTKKLLTVYVCDDTGGINIRFFHASYLIGNLEKGCEYYFFGKVLSNGKQVSINHPQIIDEKKYEPKIEPVYNLPKGLNQSDMRSVINEILPMEINEILPNVLMEKNRLMPYGRALREMHYPCDRESYKAARYRFLYQELFFLQMAIEKVKTNDNKGFFIDESDSEFVEKLGFSLTAGQKKAICDIDKDFKSGKQMNRLLQGDVGSGKTAVAAISLYKAIKAGYQGSLMAPTEILAAQHYSYLKPIFQSLGMKCALLTGKLKANEKRRILKEISSGKVDAILGTHAIIQENVSFKNLGLVITDEQHRFGVNQRIKMSNKGIYPHILVMSATPIPRTLSVILYGDLSISTIDMLPKGRKSIISKRASAKDRENIYMLLRDEIKGGRQGYIVAPLIEESEKLEHVKSVSELKCEIEKMYEHEEIQSAVIHGGMKSEEKEQIMTDFLNKKIDVLISTVVIEVGINVPNATFMVIENAERFGLAQLHQLRGRIGRGQHQSYCFFISDSKGEIARNRLRIMEESSDGFYIAEKDLEMRGPGEIFGTRQHGIPDKTVLTAIRHIELFNKIKEDTAKYKNELTDEGKRYLTSFIREQNMLSL